MIHNNCSEEICQVCNRPKETLITKIMRIGNMFHNMDIPEDYIKLDNCNIGLSKLQQLDLI